MDFTQLGFLIALLMPLNQVIKNEFLTEENHRFVPLISIALGVIFNLVLIRQGVDVREMIINGIVAGLSSVGLFSATKNLNSDREFK